MSVYTVTVAERGSFLSEQYAVEARSALEASLMALNYHALEARIVPEALEILAVQKTALRRVLLPERVTEQTSQGE